MDDEHFGRRALVETILKGGGLAGLLMLTACGPETSATGSGGATIRAKLKTGGVTGTTPIPIINALDYGAVSGLSSSDSAGIAANTTSLQAFLDACKGNIGFLPAGIYRHNGLSFDPTANYIIFGAGVSPSATTGSVLWNMSTNPNLVCYSSTDIGDNEITLADVYLEGSETSGDGIYFTNVNRVRLYRLWISTNGGNGVRLHSCLAGVVDSCTITQNGQYGLWLDTTCNQFNILNCIVNTNSRKDGYANIACIGSSGGENLGVNISGCDWSYAGQNTDWATTSGNSIGLVVQNTYSANIIGNYAEQGTQYNSYIGGNTKGIRFNGNYLQDGAVLIQTAQGSEVCFNVVRNVSLTTSLTVDTVAPSVVKVDGNIPIGSVTFSFPGSSKQVQEYYDSAPPTSGTFNVGDRVLNNAPAAGGYMGWVCVASGSPAVWKAFSPIST